MCVNPITIQVKRNGETSSTLRTSYEVPCGRCWQCRLSKQNSYLVRAYFEFVRTQKFGGCSLFLTLTFDDEHLPRINNVIPCFDRSVVTKYFKRVRKRCVDYLRKKGYKSSDASKIVSGNIKYLLTSELGDHTHRPHHHVIWFCSSLFPAWVFRKIVADCWQLGFVEFGSENYGFVKDIRGIQYVTKYIGKTSLDESYYNRIIDYYRNEVNKFKARVEFYTDKYRNSGVAEHVQITFDKYRSLIQKNSDILDALLKDKPFTAVSQNFGMFALSDSCPYKFTNRTFYDGVVSVLDKVYPLPSYYSRKLMYDVQVENVSGVNRVRFVLNDFGRDVHQIKLDKQLSSYRDRLIVSSTVYDGDVDRLTKFGYNFKSDSEVSNLITKFTDGFSDDFIKYGFFYRHYLKLVLLCSDENDNILPYYVRNELSCDLDYIDCVSSGRIPPLDTEDLFSYGFIDCVSSIVCNFVSLWKKEYDDALTLISILQSLRNVDSIYQNNYKEKVVSDQKFVLGILK